MDSEHADASRRYPMHTETQARYSLGLLGRDRYCGHIDEATYQKVVARIFDRWPQLKAGQPYPHPPFSVR
jgi:hypothetical protein